MVEIRIATVDDVAVITRQRRRMFEDSGQLAAEGSPELGPNFVEWVRPRMASGEYLGWIAEENGVIVGGAGVWMMPFPPHFLDTAPVRAYLLNFYVDPSMRGQGIAGRLLDLTVAEGRTRGAKVVTLHASKFGKPIYERFGFKPTNEMMLKPGEGAV